MNYSDENWEKFKLKVQELGVPLQNNDGTYKSLLEWLQEVSDELYGNRKNEEE